MKISSTRSMLKPPMVSWPGIGVRRIPMILPNSGKLSLSREFAEEDHETCGERIHGTLLATCDQSASRICPRIGPVSHARQECPSRSVDELTLWHLPNALAPVSVAGRVELSVWTNRKLCQRIASEVPDADTATVSFVPIEERSKVQNRLLFNLSKSSCDSTCNVKAHDVKQE